MSSSTFDYQKFNAYLKTPEYWGKGYDPTNGQHRYIISLLHQIGWTVPKPSNKSKNLPDYERFGKWLQSEKAPVSKPWRKMNKQELSKTIVALENMLTKNYSKNGSGTIQGNK